MFANGTAMSSILIPNPTATIAEIICPNNLVNGLIVFISSIIHVIEIIIIPKNRPNNFFPYCSIPK